MMRQGKAMADTPIHETPGARFRAALAAEKPLQVVGAINAYVARLAEATGFRAIYLSGGGVAANSLGIPDLGISTMEDVLTDVRRITEACPLPLLVDIDTGWGGAFNIARTIRQMIKAGAAAVHIEDQVSAKRCGHRPGKELVPAEEMADRIKAAVDARTDPHFVIMARTDALASEGLARRHRARTSLRRRRRRHDLCRGCDRARPSTNSFAKPSAFPSSPTSPSSVQTPLFTRERACSSDGVDIALYCCAAYRAMNAAALKVYEHHPHRGHAERRAAADADPRRTLQLPRLSRLRAEARQGSNGAREQDNGPASGRTRKSE
jgi:methylisocitrate lyase